MLRYSGVHGESRLGIMSLILLAHDEFALLWCFTVCARGSIAQQTLSKAAHLATVLSEWIMNSLLSDNFLGVDILVDTICSLFVGDISSSGFFWRGLSLGFLLQHYSWSKHFGRSARLNCDRRFD